jgi:hypothetical protein
MAENILNAEIKQETAPLGILTYLDTYFLNNPEKLRKAVCFLVINSLPDITSSLIKGLRKKGLSHEQIAKSWGYNLGKGTIHQLESKQYFPKLENKQIQLLKHILDLF